MLENIKNFFKKNNLNNKNKEEIHETKEKTKIETE